MMTLIGGRLISGLGSGIFGFALSLYVLDLSGSAFLFSVVLGFALIPGVSVNLFAGSLVDKWNKKAIIIATDILSALSIIAMLPLWVNYSESIPFLVVYASLLSMIQALNNLAVMSYIPELVDAEQVPATNSVLQIVNTLITFVGPMLGAVCYGLWDMQIILIVDAASFFLAGIMEFKLRAKFPAEPSEASYWKGMKDAYSFLIEKPVLRFLILLAIIINGLYMPLILLAIPFISYEVMEVSSFQLSLIEAAWAIGGAIGGLYIATQKNTFPFIRGLFVLLGVQALLIILWILPAELHFDGFKWGLSAYLCVNLLAIGVLNVIQNIPLFSYVQLMIPDALRGKVLGFVNVFMMVSTPIGMFVFGYLLQNYDWRIICTSSGLFILALCVFAQKSVTFIKFKTQLVQEENAQFNHE